MEYLRKDTLSVLRLVFSMLLMFASAGPLFYCLHMSLEGDIAMLRATTICIAGLLIGYRLLPLKGDPVWTKVCPWIDQVLIFGALGICALAVIYPIGDAPQREIRHLYEMSPGQRVVLCLFSFGFMDSMVAVLFMIHRIERGGRPTNGS